MSDSKTKDAPAADAPKEKAPPREPAEYIVLTTVEHEGLTLYREIEKVIALTAKKAKALVAANLSKRGELVGDGVDLIATPARTFVPERARVEAREPVVKVG